MAHATNKRPPLLTPSRRRYLYRVTAALLLAAAAYGYVTDQQVAVLVSLAGTVLGLVADKHVSATTPEGQ